MAFTEDKRAIIVTARQQGMYIIDVSDPASMSLAARRETQELTTGVCVAGNYAFLADRRMGIEIWDVSDVYAPRYVNGVLSEDTSTSQREYQDCVVDGHFLYVGVYDGKGVAIYDIANLQTPVLAATIELDGCGQGVAVQNGILYASTALASRGISGTRGEAEDYASGAGNGLEIYDVSDAYAPVHLSTLKLEGRCSCNLHDVWDVSVSGTKAYVSNMYSGVWVVDVSDPSAPVIEENYVIKLYPGDEDYREYNGEAYALPFDDTKESRGCVWHVAVEDGRLYVATYHEGIYEIVSEDFQKSAYTPTADVVEGEKPQTEPILIPGYQTTLKESTTLEGCVWAVAQKDGLLYAACGYAGIAVMDTDMNVLDVYPTEDPVRDVKIRGEYLYTAEMESGVSIYQINGSALQRVGNCPLTNDRDTAMQIELTETGRYVIVHTALTQFRIVDATNVFAPTMMQMSDLAPGRMDIGSICTGLVAGRYVGVLGRDNQYWFTETADGLALVASAPARYYSEVSGSAAVGDFCVSIYRNSYFYYDPLTTDEGTSVSMDGVSMTGKCASNGEILVITRMGNGSVTVLDASDIDRPQLIGAAQFNGHVGIASFDGEDIYIPLGHEGLMRLQKQ